MFGSRMVPSFWPITSFLVGWFWDQGLQTKSCRNLEVTLILGLDNPSGVILCTGTLLSCYLWFGISWDWRGTYFCELDHILFVRKADGLRFTKFVCVFVGIHQSVFWFLFWWSMLPLHAIFPVTCILLQRQLNWGSLDATVRLWYEDGTSRQSHCALRRG